METLLADFRQLAIVEAPGKRTGASVEELPVSDEPTEMSVFYPHL